MANGFGSLYVGSMGLRGSQNALNVVANNLSNVDTEGYVRQQVIFQDVDYNKFANASISDQRIGIGVSIGDVVHARDMFLDSAYRQENGRQKFYAANYEAVTEIETLLREGEGTGFASAISDLYSAFSEFSESPAEAVNQNLVAQKSALFLSRAAGLYQGYRDYQTDINTKIRDDVNRINEIGKEIHKLNDGIQRIESAGVETAMDLRDARDQLLDELSGLANISYKENVDGIVRVKLEGTDFVTEVTSYEIGLKDDPLTSFVTPYWTQLSDTKKDDYYEVFSINNISSELNNDIGEVKALLLARGDRFTDYRDIDGLTSTQYDRTLGNSIMMNQESELDRMIHQLVTSINDLLSPIDYAESVYDGVIAFDANGEFSARDPEGNTVTLSKNDRVFDASNSCVGSDGKIPTHELFSRIGCERYTPYKVTNTSGNEITIYLYNEEDLNDDSLCYTLNSLRVNEDVAEDPSLIPHKHNLQDNKGIAYDMAEEIYALWSTEDYVLNPSDITPTTFSGFYTKLVGELANTGNIYKTVAESLDLTRETIEASRQGVTGVSSDEELADMIKYQNAYNASSRYINVVSEMIEHLINNLG